MMGIRDKLLLVIGDSSINQWARDRELPPQTVHGWIDKDRVPRKGGMEALVNATGIPEHWWISGVGPPPSRANNYPPPDKATIIVSGSGKHGGLLLEDSQAMDSRHFSDDFVLVPKYDVHASAGHGAVVHSEQIVDYLAFKKAWIKSTLGCGEKDLALITVKGDSMEPTLSSDDLILVNLRKNQIADNAVYVLQYDGSLLVKRIQRLMSGSVIVKGDNPEYRAEELSADQAGLLRVFGMVVWYGRKM